MSESETMTISPRGYERDREAGENFQDAHNRWADLRRAKRVQESALRSSEEDARVQAAAILTAIEDDLDALEIELTKLARAACVDLQLAA